MRSAVLLFVLAYSVSAATFKPATFAARRDYPALGWVYIADVNGDGIPDIVASYISLFNVLLGNGDGTFRLGPQTVIPWEGAEWPWPT